MTEKGYEQNSPEQRKNRLPKVKTVPPNLSKIAEAMSHSALGKWDAESEGT